MITEHILCTTTKAFRNLNLQTGCREQKKYKIEEERGCATWQHQIRPVQQPGATWHPLISASGPTQAQVI
jgi:hypothetical protein